MLRDITIKVDDLGDGAVFELLHAHRQEMLNHSPPESVHALDVDAIKSPSLTFWSARNALSNDLGRSSRGVVIGCVALKNLSKQHAELKSMKVSDVYLGQGVGRLLLNHVLAYAKRSGYQRVSLETGTQPVFEAARGLYESVGFKQCEPFSDYVYDRNSVCMSLKLVDL